MGCWVVQLNWRARAYLLCCRLPATAAPVATLWQTGAGVWGLSHEDPWLGAALSDGTVVLLNAEAAMRQGNNRRAVAQVGSQGCCLATLCSHQAGGTSGLHN